MKCVRSAHITCIFLDIFLIIRYDWTFQGHRLSSHGSRWSSSSWREYGHRNSSRRHHSLRTCVSSLLYLFSRDTATESVSPEKSIDHIESSSPADTTNKEDTSDSSGENKQNVQSVAHAADTGAQVIFHLSFPQSLQCVSYEQSSQPRTNGDTPPSSRPLINQQTSSIQPTNQTLNQNQVQPSVPRLQMPGQMAGTLPQTSHGYLPQRSHAVQGHPLAPGSNQGKTFFIFATTSYWDVAAPHLGHNPAISPGHFDDSDMNGTFTYYDVIICSKFGTGAPKKKLKKLPSKKKPKVKKPEVGLSEGDKMSFQVWPRSPSQLFVPIFFQEAAVQVLGEQREKGVYALSTRKIWELISQSGLVDTKWFFVQICRTYRCRYSCRYSCRCSRRTSKLIIAQM